VADRHGTLWWKYEDGPADSRSVIRVHRGVVDIASTKPKQVAEATSAASPWRLGRGLDLARTSHEASAGDRGTAQTRMGAPGIEMGQMVID
jgi:hypothetical protein